jgi:hypothetical protein
MGQSVDDYNAEYRQKFRAVRPIFETHFPSVEERKIIDIVHRFTAEKAVGLYENWNYKQQQELLTKLRAQLARAAQSLSKIHKVVLSEVSVNLSLPLEVLNGTYDFKTCSQEVYDSAPTGKEVDEADQVFRGLLSLSENIDKAIKYTQDELPTGISVGNRNIEAWRIVEAAVEVCRTYPDLINVPKKMNGSGPLRRLLVDLFKHYDINSNVDAAFNGWEKQIDRKREFLDLLPID